MQPKNRAALRTAAVVALASLSLGACVSQKHLDEQFAGVNSRIDSLDARVAQASQRADVAATNAQTANQRLDAIDARVSNLERAPARTPRG